jgi:pyridoxamine 5'-phosphate oxidase
LAGNALRRSRVEFFAFFLAGGEWRLDCIGMSNVWEPSDLSRVRVSYDRGEFLESDLLPTPLAQFEDWLQAAIASGLPEPNAMVLATVDGAGRPAARTVLLKGVDVAGFRFFTNYASRKAQAIGANSRVSLVFPWFALHRQVAVLGVAEKMPAAESAAYFRSRPRDSQLAAWASVQSAPIENRAVLEKRMAMLEKRWPAGVGIPAPDFWGGFLVRVESMEFWHGRTSRLHDRLRFEAARPGAALNDAAAWRVRRYAP